MRKITHNCFTSPAAIRLFESSLIAERLAEKIASDKKIDEEALIELAKAMNSIAANTTDKLLQITSIYDNKRLHNIDKGAVK